MAVNCIVSLSDFGSKDPYVGIMKGVINQIAPDSNIIDLGHQLPPGDIQEGAFQLWQAAGYFPHDAVFLAVVDPGVGTQRKGLYLQRGNQVFIGPDNGLFTYLGYKSTYQAWKLDNPDLQLKNPSNTFHGRDIFAPAAAYAALGRSGDQFGEQVHSLVNLPDPICQITKDYLQGEIISTDRFGNLITTLGQFRSVENTLEFNSWIEDHHQVLPPQPRITLEKSGKSLALVTTFSDIPPGSCAGLIGSSGLLEIAANQNKAADLLDLDRGDRVKLTWK